MLEKSSMELCENVSPEETELYTGTKATIYHGNTISKTLIMALKIAIQSSLLLEDDSTESLFLIRIYADDIVV